MGQASLLLRRVRLAIPRDALVLDLGSGDNPHGRADLLCDRDVVVSQGAGPLYLDRPLVVATPNASPSIDGAFDYAVCSHLLSTHRGPTM